MPCRAGYARVTFDPTSGYARDCCALCPVSLAWLLKEQPGKALIEPTLVVLCCAVVRLLCCAGDGQDDRPSCALLPANAGTPASRSQPIQQHRGPSISCTRHQVGPCCQCAPRPGTQGPGQVHHGGCILQQSELGQAVACRQLTVHGAQAVELASVNWPAHLKPLLCTPYQPCWRQHFGWHFLLAGVYRW